MNVIFLDNDGVICLSNNWGGRFNKQKKWMRLNPDLSDFPVDCKFDNFDTKAIKVLNSILEETGAEIVVSSDWKNNASLEEIGDYYEAQGISKRPIAVTQKFTDISDEMVTEGFKFSFTEELEMERYFEIEKYLKDHKEIEKWVAIDDLHMGIHIEASSYGPHDRDWGLENFVWTPDESQGIKQQDIKEKILKYLIHNKIIT
jgi:hypothetical protein